jgi:hypothetical protein
MAQEYHLTIEKRRRHFLGGLAAFLIGYAPFVIFPSEMGNAYIMAAYLSFIPLLGLSLVIVTPFRKIYGRYIWNDWVSIASFIITGAFLIYIFYTLNGLTLLSLGLLIGIVLALRTLFKKPEPGTGKTYMQDITLSKIISLIFLVIIIVITLWANTRVEYDYGDNGQPYPIFKLF